MDDPPKPLWPNQLVEEITGKTPEPDVPVEVIDQVRLILDALVEDGEADKLFVPMCPRTGQPIGEWDHPRQIPDPVPCFLCSELHPLFGLTIGVVYRPTDPD